MEIDLNISSLYIEETNCIKCSKCKKICPVNAIYNTNDKAFNILKDKCVKCRLCISICPQKCIKLTPMPKTQVIYASNSNNFISELKNDPEIIKAKKQYINQLIKELEKKNQC